MTQKSLELTQMSKHRDFGSLKEALRLPSEDLISQMRASSHGFTLRSPSIGCFGYLKPRRGHRDQFVLKLREGDGEYRRIWLKRNDELDNDECIALIETDEVCDWVNGFYVWIVYEHRKLLIATVIVKLYRHCACVFEDEFPIVSADDSVPRDIGYANLGFPATLKQGVRHIQ